MARDGLIAQLRTLREDDPWWSLVEFNADAIMVVRADGVISLVNAATEALFGRPRQQLLGAGFGFPLGEAATQELDILHPDGTRRIAEMRSIPVAWQGDAAWLATLRDVTDRHLTEERLRQSEAHLAEAWHLAGVGSWVYDGRRKVVLMSPEAAGILGLEPVPELPLDTMLATLAPDDRPRLETALDQALDGGAALDLECRLGSGGSTVIHLRAKPLADAVGRASQLVGMVQDVSERVAAEQDRLTAERNRSLAEKLQALGRIAGGATHELNNLLMPMIGLSEMVRDGLPEDAEARPALEQVLTAGGNARDVLQQLLAFSRLVEEGGEIILLNAALRDSLDLCQGLVPPGVALVAEVTEDPLFVRCSPDGLQEVVHHLLVNAFEALAGREDGRVVVRLRRQTGEHGDVAEMTVEDNGHGMEEETLRRVCEPFFTTKEVGEGCGLGLSEVYGIVSRQGGDVTVSSTPAAGTTVRVIFPLREPEAVEAALAPKLDRYPTEDRAEGG